MNTKPLDRGRRRRRRAALLFTLFAAALLAACRGQLLIKPELEKFAAYNP